jgi:leucyl aminopeptidase
MLDSRKSEFELQSVVRGAIQLLLIESPHEIAIAVSGDTAQRAHAARLALYSAWVNGAALPDRKKKRERKPLKAIHFTVVARATVSPACARAPKVTCCVER